MIRPLTTILLAGLVGLACSGGGGSSDEGGIGGSGITRGVITSTSNSATVAGTTYDDAMATIRFDGVVDPGRMLDVGMTVTILGTRNGDSGVADEIDFDDAIEGPVESVSVDSTDLRKKDVVILDQTVHVEEGRTVFVGTRFATLAMGNVVEVSGFRDADGDILATRVEFVSTDPTPEIELKGVVSGLDDSMNPAEFMIGGITVFFDPTGVSTDLSDVPGGVLMDGDFVEVEGDLRADGVTVDADAGGRIEVEEPLGGDVGDFEIEGIVSDFVSLADFEVDDQPVDASGFGVLFEPNDPSFVADGARVEVEGMLVGGVLVASEVRQRSGEVRIAAEVDASTAMPDTLTLLGVIGVVTDASTRVDDDCPPFAGDMLAGEFVEIRALVNGNQIVATDIECDDPDAVVLRARIEGFNGPARTFTLLGLVIPTDAGTSFADFPAPGVSDEDDFFAFLGTNPSVVLEAVDDEMDGDATDFDVADEVELEDED